MSSGELSLGPTEQKRIQILAKIQNLLQDGFALEGDISSLRGEVVSMSTASFGKSHRGALRLLAPQNLRPDESLLPSLQLGLRYCSKLFEASHAAVIRPTILPEKPVIIYSDAAWEPHDSSFPMGLGAVLYDGEFQDFIFSKDPQIHR
eukprot:7488120-Karenia_brevis.AAC.1